MQKVNVYIIISWFRVKNDKSKYHCLEACYMNTIELTCYTKIEPATNPPTIFAQHVYVSSPFLLWLDLTIMKD